MELSLPLPVSHSLSLKEERDLEHLDRLEKLVKVMSPFTIKITNLAFKSKNQFKRL